jgi:peptidylprolyl isomerase
VKIALTVALLSIGLAIVAGCSGSKPAEIGDRVKVAYIGKLEDGVVFDSSATGAPIEFVIGDHKIIPGLENAIVGMKAGESKSITLPPEEAYGPYREDFTHTYPADSFPSDITPQVGMVLSMQTPGGQTVPIKIIDVDSVGNVTVDGNHELAGKTLIFDFTLVEIMEDTTQN